VSSQDSSIFPAQCFFPLNKTGDQRGVSGDIDSPGGFRVTASRVGPTQTRHHGSPLPAPPWSVFLNRRGAKPRLEPILLGRASLRGRSPVAHRGRITKPARGWFTYVVTASNLSSHRCPARSDAESLEPCVRVDGWAKEESEPAPTESRSSIISFTTIDMNSTSLYNETA
jgi:hypothetical protein